MLDDFRQQADQASFFDEEPDENAFDEPRKPNPITRILSFDRRILGLTAAQRFILSFLLLVLTGLGSILVLLITGKVVPGI